MIAPALHALMEFNRPRHIHAILMDQQIIKLLRMMSKQELKLATMQTAYSMAVRQQAKALLNILQQNVTQYETAFGEIKLEPHAEGGIVQ